MYQPRFEGAPKSYLFIRSLFSYLIFITAAARKLFQLAGLPDFPKAVVLLTTILILYITQPFLIRRLSVYRHLYFAIQTSLVLICGILRPYEDTWGLILLFIGIQAVECCSRRQVMIWGTLLFVFMTVIMLLTHGLLQGLGYSMTYVAAGVIFISFDFMVIQAEKAKSESQKLLMDLEQAHQRLQATAGQVEVLAAANERNRLAHDLHDSVSQVIFSITLTAQSARILADKDPGRLREQIDRLQELTSGALSQMRALISQWRPE
jgi:signal transduction histidine kinase